VIIYVEDPNFYSKYAIDMGIEAFASLLGQECRMYNLGQTFEPSLDNNVVILQGFQFRGESRAVGACGNNIDNIRAYFPNSYIIVMGSYSTHCPDYIEYDHPSKADLHLDTCYNVSEEFKKRGYNADMFLWSGNQHVFNQAKNFYATYGKLPSVREAICLCRCPASYPGGYFYDRNVLFRGIMDAGISLGYNLELFSLEGSIRAFAESDVAIGTTTPSSDPQRNGKGFRDWLGPFVGCPLVADDYNGYLDLYEGIVPMYKYGDIADCVNKIRLVQQFDPEAKSELLARQVAFAEHNTVEQQLLRVYKKYVTKTEPDIQILQRP